jgi:RNA polymerase sigma-70 factor (ECF subfamily)
VAALGAALALAACGRSAPPPLEVSRAAADAPRAIAFDPPLGASAVDPARATIAVTFDREMDPEGWAWVVEESSTAPELGASSWDPAVRTNTAQVKLEPGRSYVVWVNSERFAYFRDRAGTSAPPVRWTFATRGAPAGAASPPAAAPPIAPISAHARRPPSVVALEPPNGARDVDPETKLLRATFDREMEGSWAWVREGENFPEMAGQAYFESDRKTAVLPVRLEPGRAYAVWLNSERHLLFRDAAGTPAPPLRWTFTTRAAPR